MKRWWRASVAVLAVSWIVLAGSVAVDRAAAQTRMTGDPKGKTAGEFFKNVTTSTLKGLSVDDFIAAMGVIAADLGLDCADCHPGAGSDEVNWVVDTPPKVTTRRMVEMVATINKTSFGGVQRVTCWTCHHGRMQPATTIALDTLYDTPNAEKEDLVRVDKGESADKILDRYIESLGGAKRLAGLTSYVVTGSSLGYFGIGGAGDFTIYAKAPNQRATLIRYKDHPERGESTWAFDGTTGWVKTPRALLDAYELEGGELDGARIEAQLSFPGQIKKVLANVRAGERQSIGDRDYQVVQGSGPRGSLATLYFDPDTGLLTRLIRYSPSPVGRMPTQIDYSDYRDVGGIKFPFEIKFQWLDGRYTAKVSGVKTNVPIDAALFGRPSARK
jgi:hypothetical protein